MPVDRPTVAKADIASKTSSIKCPRAASCGMLLPSVMLSKITDAPSITPARAIMVRDLLMLSSVSAYQPTRTWLRPLILALIKPTHARKVVVLSPPAHDPGEPPISISDIMNTSEIFVRLEISAELNPAVLQVTD